MPLSQRRSAAGLAMLAVICSFPVSAQVSRSGGGSANAQLMQQYQQLASERSQLQAENAKLKKDSEDLKKQLDALNKQLAGLKSGSSRNEAALAAAKAEGERNAKTLADTKSRMEELIARFRETITQLRGVETERTQLQQQLSEKKAAYDQCAERNYALFQTAGEILTRFEHQGTFSCLARDEPFTRIKRTRIENLVDEYRQRAEELRVQKAQQAAKPTGAAAAPPGPSVAAPQPPAPPAPQSPGLPKEKP